MFAAPATVLAPREGSLTDAPLPLLLHALHCEGRTVTLELKLRGLEKRIQLEGGSPVACRSNLLHETLGRFLVEKGKLTEERYQQALQGSVQTGKRMGEWLVAQGAIQPFELYRLMQANLATRILDAFRWSEATWRLTGESEAAELALKMNPAQLVLTGVCGFSPLSWWPPSWPSPTSSASRSRRSRRTSSPASSSTRARPGWPPRCAGGPPSRS